MFRFAWPIGPLSLVHTQLEFPVQFIFSFLSDWFLEYVISYTITLPAALLLRLFQSGNGADAMDCCIPDFVFHGYIPGHLCFPGSSFPLPCHLSLSDDILPDDTSFLLMFGASADNVRSHPNSDGMYFFLSSDGYMSLNSMISRSSKRCPSATPSFSFFSFQIRHRSFHQ